MGSGCQHLHGARGSRWLRCAQNLGVKPCCTAQRGGTPDIRASEGLGSSRLHKHMCSRHHTPTTQLEAAGWPLQPERHMTCHTHNRRQHPLLRAQNCSADECGTRMQQAGPAGVPQTQGRVGAPQANASGFPKDKSLVRQLAQQHSCSIVQGCSIHPLTEQGQRVQLSSCNATSGRGTMHPLRCSNMPRAETPQAGTPVRLPSRDCHSSNAWTKPPSWGQQAAPSSKCTWVAATSAPLPAGVN